MFQDSLFSIIAIEPAGQDSIVSQIRINAGHAIFAGHFPGSPVTPGVIQMEWIKAILERQLGEKVRLKTMRTCKFLEVLNPNETPVVNIHIKYKRLETLEVVASGEYAGGTFFKMQATYI